MRFLSCCFRRWLVIAALFPALFLIAACETVPKTADKGLAPLPGVQSILVLPPIDTSLEVDAGRAYMPTITQPLIESGYYVFPVAVVDRILRENGLPDAASMHSIALDKLSAFFKPDAVMYITLERWGSEYRVLTSVTRVQLNARLVDAKSGQVLWEGKGSASRGNKSHDSSGKTKSLAELLLSAVARQVGQSVKDTRSVEVAADANRRMLLHRKSGLPPGPYNRKLLQAKANEAARKAKASVQTETKNPSSTQVPASKSSN